LSYDLMVFDAAVAPRGGKAFIDWYEQQTQWTETHGYNAPDVSTAPLRAWFQEIIKTFPPMNGPLASDDVDDPKVTDYSVGQSVIYCAFAWSQAEPAYDQVKRLAAKYRVGFFDVSSNASDIWLPTPDGGFEKSTG
jgi:hypothetical protein